MLARYYRALGKEVALEACYLVEDGVEDAVKEFWDDFRNADRMCNKGVIWTKINVFCLLLI